MDIHWQKIYSLQNKNWWWKGKEKIINFLLNRYCKLNSGSKVLDVGCGPGFSVRILNHYCLGFGVEIFDEALNFCRRQGLGRVAKSYAECLPFQKNLFDGITLIDVLEHMDDDRRVILECRRVVKAGGFLLLIVPAYKELWTNRDIYFGHKRRYSSASLKGLLTVNGFKIEKISHTNSFLIPPLLLLAIIEHISCSEVKVNNEGVKVLHPIINKILSYLLEFEISLIHIFNLSFGSSIVCLARKQ